MWTEPRGFGALSTFSLASIAEHVFQPLPQTVIDEYRFLQALAQVLDLNKILFQQVSPCCIPPRQGEVGNEEGGSLMGPSARSLPISILLSTSSAHLGTWEALGNFIKVVLGF